MNSFRCKAEESGYCNMWLRACVGGENCAQGCCPYCVYAGISPAEKSICNECEKYSWKKENYREVT